MPDRFQVPPVPFLLRAQHRLLVRGAHDNAVFIRQARVGRIVFVERVVPHRRPKVIAFQPQDHLKDLRVEPAVVIGDPLGHRRIGTGRDRPEFGHDPIRQVGCLVI